MVTVNLSTKDEKKIKVKFELATAFSNRKKTKPLSGYLRSQIRLIKAIAIRIVQHQQDVQELKTFDSMRSKELLNQEEALNQELLAKESIPIPFEETVVQNVITFMDHEF